MKAQKLFFGPLLLAQGLWVRKKTPVLPEPDVKSTGVMGTGPQINILLLGDSSAAGVGATKPEETLLSQLIMRLSASHQVHYQMLAQTGRTSAQMLKVLSELPPHAYDVVITALGVNDVTKQVSPQQWKLLQKQLVQMIDEKFSPNQLIMSGLPPVRDFPALPWPLNSYLGDAADELNDILMALTESKNGVRFLSLRDYPVEAMAAVDGFHPGPKVYQLWAKNIEEIILAT